MNDRAVLVYGAGGFLGRDLVTRFWNAGMKVYGTASRPSPEPPYVPMWPGREPGDWGPPPEDLHALVIAAGPRPGLVEEADTMRHLLAVRNAIAWARHYGVQRVVFVSVLGASTEGPHPLQRVKAQAEAIVERAGLAWTIVRPSLLFGRGADLFDRLESWASLPVSLVPVSPAVVQPVFVGDVSEAILRIIGHPATVGRTFDLPGPHLVTLRDLIRQMAADGVWWQRRVLSVAPDWRFARFVRWPWTPGEWDYFETEPRVRDSRWLVDLGILPRTLSMYYAPFGRHLS